MLCALLLASTPPKIYSRADWGAKPVAFDGPRHRVTKITIHHTGVDQNPKRSFFDKLRGLQSWSQRADKLAGGKDKPSWIDIPYHYYIDIEGECAEARPWFYRGDTNTSYDPTGHLLIVVEGSFPSNYFNIRQKRMLFSVTLELAKRFRVPASEIKGHIDYAPGETDCPGESIMKILPELRDLVAKSA